MASSEKKTENSIKPTGDKSVAQTGLSFKDSSVKNNDNDKEPSALMSCLQRWRLWALVWLIVMIGLLIIVIIIVVVLTNPGDGSTTEKPLGGGYWQDVPVDDPTVQEIARWIVQEVNREQGRSTRLVAVIKAASQSVAGTNYDLTLEVEENSRKYPCRAQVFEPLPVHKENGQKKRKLSLNSC